MRLYSFMTRHLASHGYVVITYNTPVEWCHLLGNLNGEAHRAGLSGSLTHLSVLGEDPESPVFGLIDSSRTAVMGHSWGGPISLELAAIDPTIDALVTLAGAAEHLAAGISAPSLVLVGDRDCISNNPVSSEQAYEALPTSTDRAFGLMAGVNHFLLDVDCVREVPFQDHQLRLPRRYATAWFDHFLKGEATALTYLTGDQAHQDVADELLHRFPLLDRRIGLRVGRALTGSRFGAVAPRR